MLDSRACGNGGSWGVGLDVTIIDCGIGNIKSVLRMFQAADGSAEIIDRPEQLNGAKRVALPGVGAFDAGMSALAEGWIEPLNKLALERKVPVLGICLGMQLLCRKSDEGDLPGLGWIDADVTQLDIDGRWARSTLIPGVRSIAW
jgi:glutamine amidotransferase